MKKSVLMILLALTMNAMADDGRGRELTGLAQKSTVTAMRTVIIPAHKLVNHEATGTVGDGACAFTVMKEADYDQVVPAGKIFEVDGPVTRKFYNYDDHPYAFFIYSIPLKTKDPAQRVTLDCKSGINDDDWRAAKSLTLEEVQTYFSSYVQIEEPYVSPHLPVVIQ